MNYAKTKRNRKKTKYNNILQEDLGMFLSENATKTIVICNGGLVNGINQEAIYEIFHQFGTIQDIAMVPDKSYSFVTMTTIGESETAYESVNNQRVWQEIKGPVFLGFVQNIPSKLLKRNVDFSQKPPGLFVLENFVSPEEEEKILGCLKSKLNHGKLKHRVVTHYGFEFKYTTNDVDVTEPIEPIPPELDFLWGRLAAFRGDLCFDFTPDQLTVNHYQPGQGIPPHVDTHSPFEDTILSLSLQSDVVMNFKNIKNDICNVVLPARSMCVMSGESRYGWTHGITPRKSDIVTSSLGGLTLMEREARTSLTFRKTRQQECKCTFHEYCDTFTKKMRDQNVTVKLSEMAAEIESTHVHQVYEKIASHFSETRHKPWPNVVRFVESCPTGALLVDVGCGNGKYLGLRRDVYQVGCDRSAGLVGVCRERGLESFACDCLWLPLRDGVADACLSIAVIHHLVTEERRAQAIREMLRILRPNGRALIYVWAKNQEKENKKSSYLKQKSGKPGPPAQSDTAQPAAGLPVHTNRTNFLHSDLLVPWKLKPGNSHPGSEPPTFLRFYHVYEENELKDACAMIPDVHVDDYYYDQGNWCIVLRKLEPSNSS